MNNCLYPMSLLNNEEVFNAVLDGEVLPEEAREHLEQCELCQKRLAEYTGMNNALLSVLYRRQCPTGIKLSSYYIGLLPENESEYIQRHIWGCPLCADEIEDMRRALSVERLV